MGSRKRRKKSPKAQHWEIRNPLLYCGCTHNSSVNCLFVLDKSKSNLALSHGKLALSHVLVVDCPSVIDISLDDVTTWSMREKRLRENFSCVSIIPFLEQLRNEKLYNISFMWIYTVKKKNLPSAPSLIKPWIWICNAWLQFVFFSLEGYRLCIMYYVDYVLGCQKKKREIKISCVCLFSGWNAQYSQACECVLPLIFGQS